METPFVVANPRAANGRVGRNWAEIEASLRQHLGAFEFQHTTGPEAATGLARDALRAGHRVICSLGGDGTHSQVVNGFFDGDEAIRPDACLAILPVGTGGDFRTRLTAPALGGAGGARGARGGGGAAADAGVLDYRADDGTTARRHFLNIASFGLSGRVDRIVNRSTKIFGGRASFLIGTARGTLGYRARPLRLDVDGERVFEGRVLSVAVCNGQYFGGGMWVAPNADLSDGLFDIVVIPWRGVVRHSIEAGRIYKGTHLDVPGVRVFRGRVAAAECDGESLLDIDGESPGGLPSEIRILPGALRVKEAPRK